MRSRNIKFSIWLSEKEYIKLEKLAEITGLKKAPIVRSLITGCELKPHPPENFAKLLRELSAIGSNINQIARVANTTKTISSDEITEIQTMFKTLWRMLKNI